MRPGIFGLIPGIANITGIALIGILTVMVVCSMPFVRRGGYFEVFYFTHLLYGAVHVLILLTNRVSHHGFSTGFLNRVIRGFQQVFKQGFPTGFLNRVIKGVSAGFPTELPTAFSTG